MGEGDKRKGSGVEMGLQTVSHAGREDSPHPVRAHLGGTKAEP